jgi:hypothetical protein
MTGQGIAVSLAKALQALGLEEHELPSTTAVVYLLPNSDPPRHLIVTTDGWQSADWCETISLGVNPGGDSHVESVRMHFPPRMYRPGPGV